MDSQSLLFRERRLAKDVPIADTFRGVLPFFLAGLVRVALLIAFPGIVLFLPYALR